MKNSIYAAIDIGSYNCRLTIFKRKNGSSNIIHNFSYGTNLIKNLSYNNEFTDENISKTLNCMINFSKKLKQFNVDVYRCIATEACRQVINSEFFIEKVRGSDARFQDIMTQTYNEYKISQGFNPNEIIAKSRSLKGVLEPFSTNGNLQLLKRAGFKDIMTVFKYACFSGFALSQSSSIHQVGLMILKVEDKIRCCFT